MQNVMMFLLFVLALTCNITHLSNKLIERHQWSSTRIVPCHGTDLGSMSLVQSFLFPQVPLPLVLHSIVRHTYISNKDKVIIFEHFLSTVNLDLFNFSPQALRRMNLSLSLSLSLSLIILNLQYYSKIMYKPPGIEENNNNARKK